MARVVAVYPTTDKGLSDLVKSKLGYIIARKIQYTDDLTEAELRSTLEELRRNGLEEDVDFEQIAW